VIPSPHQKPKPPLRVAATSEESYAAVGRRGLPIFLAVRTSSISELTRYIGAYHAGRREAGHPGPGEVAVILFRQGDGQGEGQGEGWTTDVCSRITVAQLTSVGPSPVHPPPPSATATPTAGVPPSVGGSGGVGWRTGVLGLLVAIAALALALSLASRRGGAVATPPGATSDDGPGAGEPPEAGPSG